VLVSSPYGVDHRANSRCATRRATTDAHVGPLPLRIAVPRIRLHDDCCRAAGTIGPARMCSIACDRDQSAPTIWATSCTTAVFSRRASADDCDFNPLRRHQFELDMRGDPRETTNDSFLFESWLRFRVGALQPIHSQHYTQTVPSTRHSQPIHTQFPGVVACFD
jgi:hypothetical protein